jgi:hypothetical protein
MKAKAIEATPVINGEKVDARLPDRTLSADLTTIRQEEV